MSNTNQSQTASEKSYVLPHKAAIFAMRFFEKHTPQTHVFHNLAHTTEVVQAAIRIGKNSGLTTEELNIVTAAAWLHDLGYCIVRHGHEQQSCKIAVIFLNTLGYDRATKDAIRSLISATQFPHNPQNLMEQVLCDADLFHLSAPNYEERADLLRIEYRLNGDGDHSNEEWAKVNVKFFQKHEYFSPYGKEILGPNKNNNLRNLQSRLQTEVPA